MKKRKCFAIVILLLMLMAKKVYAFPFSVPSSSMFDSGSPSSGEPPTAIPENFDGDTTDYIYTCKYQYKISSNISVDINTYDKEGNITNESTPTPQDDSIVSGVSIGISIEETQTVTGEITKIIVTKASKTTQYYIRKARTETCEAGACVYSGPGYYSRSCPPSNPIFTFECTPIPAQPVEVTDENDAKYKECKKAAIEDLEKKVGGNFEPTYNVNLKDPNDVNNSSVTTVTGTPVQPCGILNPGTEDMVKKASCHFSYMVNKTCIDVKTAKVRYILDNNKCAMDEIEVPKYGGRWQYFIPLNTKNDDDFFLAVLASGKSKLNKDQCEYVIDHYNAFANMILKLDGSGISSDSDKAKEQVEDGCILASIIKIPAQQKFYNEKNSKIRGYGSYYRPIDIYNPFPNGLSATSIWNGLIDTADNVIKVTDKNEVTKKYNLADSFKKITYSVYNIDANAIRTYNHQERNFYTSWENMNLDGTSKFVNQYLTRHNNRNYYRLGCGPANSDWEECKQ